jgi:hypothetical protein
VCVSVYLSWFYLGYIFCSLCNPIESIILNETLLDEELEEGNVVFFGDNENEWRHPYCDEVVEKLKKISKDYKGVFVGTFDWNFYEDDSIKRYTFSENGDIVEDSIEN